MRRTFLLAPLVLVVVVGCDLLKKKDDADAAADAAAAAVTAAPTAAPTDPGGATATPTGAATLGKPGTVAPGTVKTDGGPVADAGPVGDAGVREGGAIPAPTLTIPQFDGGIPPFDAGAFVPPNFDAGGFKPPWQPK